MKWSTLGPPLSDLLNPYFLNRQVNFLCWGLCEKALLWPLPAPLVSGLFLEIFVRIYLRQFFPTIPIYLLFLFTSYSYFPILSFDHKNSKYAKMSKIY